MIVNLQRGRIVVDGEPWLLASHVLDYALIHPLRPPAWPAGLDLQLQDADGLRDRLLRAIESRSTRPLADDLGRVRLLPDREVEIEDLGALTAWLVSQLTASRPLALATCKVCADLWIRDGRAQWCARPSCRTVGAQARYRAQHDDHHRKRARVYAQLRRGTLTRSEYVAWMASNGLRARKTDRAA